MLENLKKEVFDAFQLLLKYNLVTFYWGNISAIDNDNRYIVVTPNGIESTLLRFEDLVVTDLKGHVIEGKHEPSIDLATHLELYKAFPSIRSIVHTHSHFATIFSQLSISIPPLGTTHADYFHGEIPCTRKLKSYEIKGNYERENGAVIVERFKKGKLSPDEIPGILVCNHAPFTWGISPEAAVTHSYVLEEVAFMAWHCMALPDKYLVPMQRDLLERHYHKNTDFLHEKHDN